MLVRYNSVFVPLCSPNTCKDVFNPNVTAFQSNCAEGLHFSAFLLLLLLLLLLFAGAGKDAFRRESADKAEQSVALWRRKRIQRRKKMLFLSNIQHRLQRHRSRWNLPLRSMSSRKRRLARKTYILSKSQNKDSKRTL